MVRSGGVLRGLVEREADLARVDVLLDRVPAGAGVVAVVEGPAGIGKTELMDALGARARERGFGVLSARGSEFEQEIAFGIARQLFVPMLRAASPGERRRLVDGVAQVGVRALGIEAGEPPADRFAAVHGLYWLCANRAERGPLVVVIDDVQCVDDPSLAWLGYLARRAADLGLLLVGSLRSGDPGAERAELARLVAGRDVERIALRPLSPTAVGAIVRAELDANAEEPFCAACAELTGGNPLFLRELLVAAREQALSANPENVDALRRIAPAAVGVSVLARLQRLGGGAVALARALAVLGPGTEVVLAARLADLDPVVAELTADRLAAAEILAPARPLEFVHPLIAAAVREDIAPGALRVAHCRAARLIDREGEGSLGRVAAHLLECGPGGDRWAVEHLRDAALEALARGAPEIAARHARRALAEPPAQDMDAGVLLVLGTAELRAGQPDATAHLEQTLEAAGSDLGTMLAVCTLLPVAYTECDRADRAVAVLERALAAVGDRRAAAAVSERLAAIEPLPAVDAAGLALGFESVAAMVGMLDERTALAALRRAEAVHARLNTIVDPTVYVFVTLAYQAAQENRADEAQALAERALAFDPYPPPICRNLIITLAQIECYDALQRLCEDLLAAARQRGAVHEIAATLGLRALASIDRGALADAEADARWSLERAEGIFRTTAVSGMIRVLIERDALEAAEDMAGQVVDPRQSRAVGVTRFLIARGQLRVAQGRLREALEDFLDCGQRCARLGAERQSATPWRSEAALVHAALGDAGEARRLADEQLELARAFGRPRALGISLRARALIEHGKTSLELLREAVDTLERSQSPLELARARADYGAALRRAGHRIEARAELERALDGAHHCGARRIAARARAELIAAGAKPRRDAITGRDALTAGELRVARLAAQGLTNRDIAQALFITTKTAKAHLNRVYRKLDITRRGQLADALAGQLSDIAQTSAVAEAIS
ncbi:MAG: AAA family ATPase [Solirubrobacteraceae bacterium]